MTQHLRSKFLRRRQFLLTALGEGPGDWLRTEISGYQLYVQPDAGLSDVAGSQRRLLLIGYLFDPGHPEAGNEDILTALGELDEKELMRSIDDLGGQFILISETENRSFLLHDAAAQKEVYYDRTFRVLGSQPGLIATYLAPESYVNEDAQAFYTGRFRQTRQYIGDTTQWLNIRHLMPNHLIDLGGKEVHRYFPNETLKPASMDDVVPEATTILRGLLEAAAKRYQLTLGVTAGYDSRVLLLSSLGVPCRYYVARNQSKDNHIDIAIAEKLAEVCGVVLDKRAAQRETTEEEKAIWDASLDFPDYAPLVGGNAPQMLINGNVSEIARAYYGNVPWRTGEDLASACGLGNEDFVVRHYDAWLVTAGPLCTKFGYDPHDLFYWEERMGNWAAKLKTQAALNLEVYSPFTCRSLLVKLLSVDRSLRDKHFNTLYDAILKYLHPEAAQIPVNPSPKINLIKWMKRIGIYNMYRNIRAALSPR